VLLTWEDGLVRTADSRVAVLLSGTTLREADRVTVVDLEVLLPGLVLTTALEFEEELRDEGLTAEVDRFTVDVLLTAFFTADELPLE
jgi:hypothetical protein